MEWMRVGVGAQIRVEGASSQTERGRRGAAVVFEPPAEVTGDFQPLAGVLWGGGRQFKIFLSFEQLEHLVELGAEVIAASRVKKAS